MNPNYFPSFYFYSSLRLIIVCSFVLEIAQYMYTALVYHRNSQTKYQYMLTQTKLNYLLSLFGNSEYKTMLVRLHRSAPTLRVTVGSCRATAIR